VSLGGGNDIDAWLKRQTPSMKLMVLVNWMISLTYSKYLMDSSCRLDPETKGVSLKIGIRGGSSS